MSNFNIFNPNRNNMKNAGDWEQDTDRQDGIEQLGDAKSMTINTALYSTTKIVKALMDVVNEFNEPSTPYDLDITPANAKQAIKDWYELKFDKANITSELGTSEEKVPSQALLNNQINKLKDGETSITQKPGPSVNTLDGSVTTTYVESQRGLFAHHFSTTFYDTTATDSTPTLTGPHNTGQTINIAGTKYRIKYFTMSGLCPSDTTYESEIDVSSVAGDNFRRWNVIDTKGYVIKFGSGEYEDSSVLPYLTAGSNSISYIFKRAGTADPNVSFLIQSSYPEASEWTYSIFVYYYDMDSPVTEPE